MNEQMEYPETFEGFAKEFGFKDDKEVYTNGADLIPIFRVKQWLEQDNKLRAIETDTAYECGKHANKWIPCSERLPEEYGNYLVTVEANDGTASLKFQMVDHYGPDWLHEGKHEKVIAWMPLPEPYADGFVRERLGWWTPVQMHDPLIDEVVKSGAPFKKWLDSFNTESASVCFNKIQELKGIVGAGSEKNTQGVYDGHITS